MTAEDDVSSKLINVLNENEFFSGYKVFTWKFVPGFSEFIYAMVADSKGFRNSLSKMNISLDVYRFFRSLVSLKLEFV